MFTLSAQKLKVLSDFFQNLAVAWASGAVFSPIFSSTDKGIFTVNTMFNWLLSGLFLVIALKCAGKSYV